MSHAYTPLGARAMGPPAALREVIAFADAVIQTLRVSRALAESGRLICLDGLDQQVAQLCARCLGLDPADGRSLRPHLLALRAELDTTSAVLTARHDVLP